LEGLKPNGCQAQARLHAPRATATAVPRGIANAKASDERALPVVAAGAAVVVAAAPVLVPFVVLPVTLVVLPVMLLVLWLWPMALERKASANSARDRRRLMPTLAAPELTEFPSAGAAVVVAALPVLALVEFPADVLALPPAVVPVALE